MKIRNGLVSNSSSSSFLVAHTNEKTVKLLRFLEHRFSRKSWSNYDGISGSKETALKAIDRGIEAEQKDLSHAKRVAALLEKGRTNSDVVDFYNALTQIQNEHTSGQLSLTGFRNFFNNSALDDKISSLNRTITKAQEKLDDLAEVKQDIKGLPDEAQVVFLELDNYESHDLDSLIDLLGIRLIRKERG